MQNQMNDTSVLTDSISSISGFGGDELVGVAIPPVTSDNDTRSQTPHITQFATPPTNQINQSYVDDISSIHQIKSDLSNPPEEGTCKDEYSFAVVTDDLHESVEEILSSEDIQAERVVEREEFKYSDDFSSFHGSGSEPEPIGTAVTVLNPSSPPVELNLSVSSITDKVRDVPLTFESTVDHAPHPEFASNKDSPLRFGPSEELSDSEEFASTTSTSIKEQPDVESINTKPISSPKSPERLDSPPPPETKKQNNADDLHDSISDIAKPVPFPPPRSPSNQTLTTTQTAPPPTQPTKPASPVPPIPSTTLPSSPPPPPPLPNPAPPTNQSSAYDEDSFDSYVTAPSQAEQQAPQDAYLESNSLAVIDLEIPSSDKSNPYADAYGSDDFESFDEEELGVGDLDVEDRVGDGVEDAGLEAEIEADI
ncbi:hypothetical protein HK102_004253, partial [Quaeritorhiza haematococci]